MQQVLHHPSNPPQTAAVALITIAALAALGFVSAYWTWGWLAPRLEPRAQAAADLASGSSAATLFGNLQKDPNSAAQTGIAIRLLGIVAATGGHRGYALVQLEPRQILAVLEGEDVAPGIRLADVAADRVILERGANRETLGWPEKSTAAEPPALRTNR